MSPRELRKLLNRNAVLLAIYSLAEENQFCVPATATYLAPLARRSVSIVRETLADLELDRVIRRVDRRDNVTLQAVILLERPGAKKFLRELVEVYGPGRKIPRKPRKTKTSTKG